MIYYIATSFIAIVAAVNGKVYFKENFNDAAWERRWTVPSDWKPASDLGAWNHTAGEFGAESDKGIQTSEDARFYGLSAKLDSAFTNRDKELVIQMSVKHEQDLDCGGAYVKLLGDMDQSKFGGDTPYQVMFGPDICGPINNVHVSFATGVQYISQNFTAGRPMRRSTHRKAELHLYTLVVKPDNTFEVLIDLESVKTGSLADNWDFHLPKEIKDPAVSKPADWVDQKKIADPEAVKPEGWNSDRDGEWEAPSIANPEYKGEWAHPMIPNPEYTEHPNLHVRCKDCTRISLQGARYMHNVLISDSRAEAVAEAMAMYNNVLVASMLPIEARFGILQVQTSTIHSTGYAQQPTQLPPRTIRNETTGHSIVHKCRLGQGAGHGAQATTVTARTAQYLGLASAGPCSLTGGGANALHSTDSWQSIIDVDLLKYPEWTVPAVVCVSASWNHDIIGKGELEAWGLAHWPGVGLTRMHKNGTYDLIVNVL